MTVSKCRIVHNCNELSEWVSTEMHAYQKRFCLTLETTIFNVNVSETTNAFEKNRCDATALVKLRTPTVDDILVGSERNANRQMWCQLQENPVAAIPSWSSENQKIPLKVQTVPIQSRFECAKVWDKLLGKISHLVGAATTSLSSFGFSASSLFSNFAFSSPIILSYKQK